QPSDAMAGILVAGEALAQLDLPRVRGGEALDPSELVFPGLEHGRGDGIVQPEGEGLDEPGTVEVRQIASRAPGSGGRRIGWNVPEARSDRLSHDGREG